MVRSSPFGGPRLEQLAQLPAWQPGFLAAASAANCATYYLVNGYEDPGHANAIGPATMHMLMAAADSAIPDVDDDTLSDVRLQVAIARRARQVQRRVVEAIANEVETMHQRAVRHASQYLLAAIAPALHPNIHNASSPYHMWHQLCAASRHGLRELYALYTRASTATIDAPASVNHVQRAIIDPFLEAALPPTTLPEWPAATTAAVAAFAAEMRAKLAMVLLTHAAADAVPDATTFEHEHWDVAEYTRFLQMRVSVQHAPPLTLSPKDVADAVDTPEVLLRPEGTDDVATPVVELTDIEPETEVAKEPVDVLEEAPTSAGNTAALDLELPLADEMVEPEIEASPVDAAPPIVSVPPAMSTPPVVPALSRPAEPRPMTVTPLDAPSVVSSAPAISNTAFAPLRSNTDEHNASAASEIASPPVVPATPEPKEMPRLAVTPPPVLSPPPPVASAAVARLPNDVPALPVKAELILSPCEPMTEAIDLCSPASTPPPEYTSPLDSVAVKTELLAPPAPTVPVRVTHVRRPSQSHAAPQPHARAPPSEPVVTKIQGFKVTRIKITKPKASVASKRQTPSTDDEPSAKRSTRIKTEPVVKPEVVP
ncbi:hypothetical protein SDRG_00028 [Saprolegnia diclina VS20]|uniref:Uncharacterized protein n=1 Tax=Saprolegnia diclina (strain VS20) TaxID=1156394 RepID=T0QVN6_SAPDV|nr:hypothetical protein SDRG_00028 [Saprolegnia diclina VS20]EQC42289.1 hypothetical protein SDRG_00028 [Saprolegnia diclina VS20]|eukprot:XP_008603712.1 hypothetical protein SDRG_00028 [Saprolegnia diclina VS20]